MQQGAAAAAGRGKKHRSISSEDAYNLPNYEYYNVFLIASSGCIVNRSTIAKKERKTNSIWQNTSTNGCDRNSRDGWTAACDHTRWFAVDGDDLSCC